MIQLYYVSPLDLILVPLLLGTFIVVAFVLDLYNKVLSHVNLQMKEMLSKYYMELIDNNFIKFNFPFEYHDYELALQKAARWVWHYKVKESVLKKTWGRMFFKK
ncbi:hypothetical protein K502DRAFT_363429 [Neoconidiobolus thromboides FSU 785]|nr:hypothetical protein K502DRAFT_363429 [Neoconidiobolus thromboides FSU 785]